MYFCGDEFRHEECESASSEPAGSLNRGYPGQPTLRRDRCIRADIEGGPQRTVSPVKSVSYFYRRTAIAEQTPEEQSLSGPAARSRGSIGAAMPGRAHLHAKHSQGAR